MADQERTVTGEQTVLTYSYLSEAAALALEKAIASEEGNFYNCLCSIVMSAFCLEAFVNHVGMDRVEDWNERESPLDKFRRVSDASDIKIDYRKRPFQSIKEANRFRNLMAHGKTAILPISYNERRPSRGKVKRPKTKWENMCSVKKAQQLLDDLEEVMRLINERCGYANPELGLLSYAIYEKKPN